MKTLNYFFLIPFLSLNFLVSSQNQNDEDQKKISTVLENYFELEREAIHLHLNKTAFINNETIWYQGYIINRKTNKPYFSTNIFVLLFNEKGNLISEKMIYASNGVFSGKIDLNSKLESGNYYIQSYTNWMNNFSENESTITKINIINPTEGIKNYKKVNTESLELFLNPEGKNLINDVVNTIGVQVKDCNGNSPTNLEANIENQKGEILKTIKLNQFGYGKFEIIPSNEQIKVVVKNESINLEKTLPQPINIGVSIEVNTFSIENKTVIKIKTNKNSIDLINSKKPNLVIHQDQKLITYPIHLNKNELEQNFILDNSSLNEGINTIRIIDSDLQQWSERIIFIKPLSQNNFSVLKNNRKEDKINLIGYSNYPNSILSISVLPQDTKSIDIDNSIIAGITINPYLNKPLLNANYYLKNPNRLKLYELDLALLNDNTSKYNWDLMKTISPSSHYSFDIGLNIKGKIDSSIKNKTSHKVKMVVFKDRIMMSADVSENGEYEFEHLILTDSSLVKLSLQKLPDFENITSDLYPKVLNRKRIFNKPILNFIQQSCSNTSIYEAISETDFPKFNSETIKLDEVIVKKKSNELKHTNVLSNSMLRGFKIDKTNEHMNLLNFIEMNGFVVSKNMGEVSITVRQRMSLNSANPTPLVSIDDRVLFSSFNELDFMQMTEIDEIYLDSHSIVASINNNVGVIKIYTRKPQFNYFSKPDPNAFFVKEAYSNYFPFKNSDYQNTQTQGFNNFGAIDWSSLVKTNEAGEFMFDIIDYNKSKTKIIIEGFDSEGKLIHEEIIVDVK